MKGRTLVALALVAGLLVGAVAAGSVLKLVPPRRSDRSRPLDSTQLRMPSALARGSRAGQGEPEKLQMHAEVSPSPVRLGQRVMYRGWVKLWERGIQFVPPRAGGDFTWGTPRVGRSDAKVKPSDSWPWAVRDSVWIEVPLQVFRTGLVAIPGNELRLRESNPPYRRFTAHLPTVQLLVLPTLTAADSNATLRPLHGPLGAPWWERVPWRWVIAGLVALALVIALVAWLRRRRRRPAAAVVTRTAPRVAVDPSAEALAALAALRAERLPEAGRLGDHALALTRILRRFLEATLTGPRPGDTSAELTARLRASRLAPDDVQRLEGLLGVWDRVKFARAPLTLEEAHRCESAVEQFVRRPESPREVA